MFNALSLANDNYRKVVPVIQQIKLTASDGVQFDGFGTAVSLDGNRALISAPDGSKVYVFEFGNDSWQQTAVISPMVESFHFGSSLSLNGDIALIADVGDDSFRGAVYEFKLVNGVWEETFKMISDAPISQKEGFGSDINTSENQVIIGAPFYEINGERSGAAYIFQNQGASWVQVARLTPNDPESFSFWGQKVSLYQNWALVGAPFKDEGGFDRGSAYVFIKSPSGWTQFVKFTPTVAMDENNFGKEVDIYGNRLVISAVNKPDDGLNTGIAHLYEYGSAPPGWYFSRTITADDSLPNDDFAGSMSLYDNLLLVGASGVDASISDPDTGKAYLYDLAGLGNTTVLLQEYTADDASRQSFLGTSVSLHSHRSLIGASGADFGEYIGAAYSFEPIKIFDNSFE